MSCCYLFKLFANCSSTGRVLSVKRANNQDGSFRGFAFIILQGSHVKEEIEKLDGATRFNRKLKVDIINEAGKEKQKGVYLGKRKLNQRDEGESNGSYNDQDGNYNQQDDSSWYNRSEQSIGVVSSSKYKFRR